MGVDPWILGPLRIFEVAGRLLNFTRAAEALHLTQSAVSQQVRQLEDRLGFPLFVRHTRGLRLTSQGDELLKSVQGGFSEITSTVARLAPQETAVLEINCLPSLALHWLVPRLSRYYQHNPNLPVRITADLRALNQLTMEEEGIDLSIRYEPIERNQSSFEILMDEYIFPVATPEYLAMHPALQADESCEGVTFLHDASPWSGAPEYVEWQLWMQAHRPGWIGRLAGPQFNLASMMISAALNHQGIALGRTAIVLDELKSGRLVEMTGAYLQAPAHYILVSRIPGFERSAAFCHWIRSEVATFTQSRQALLPALNAT